MSSLLLSVLLVAAPRPYTVQDQVTLKRLTAFQVSPDGKQVVFALRHTDLAANRGRFDLYAVGTDGSNLRQLTSHVDNDTDPQWAADGKSIFFLSPRSGSSQVWRLPLNGGEALPVTTSPIDVDSFRLSRDGQSLAFSAEVFPDCETLECTAKRIEERAKNKASGKAYESLFVRHWDTFKDGRRAHLFVQKTDGGTPVDVMKKMNADAPSKPFGGNEEYTFTPDGKQLVFSARDVGRQEAWSTDLDLFVTSIDGSKAPIKLTTQNRGTDTQPVFSPDGKSLAYLSMARPGFEADKLRLVLRNWADGKERLMTESWDRSAESITFSADSQKIYLTAQDVGQKGIFELDVVKGEIRPLLSRGTVDAVQVAADKLVLSLHSINAPSDLYTMPIGGGATTAVTKVNGDTLAQLKLGEAEQFSFKGANDDTVYGYIVKPVDFDAKKKYPLAFLIHGGPQGSFGNDWHYRWNPQAYAGKGYVAVMIDFHGSTGYGQKFTDAISKDWGGKPLEDLQKGLAFTLSKYPFIDKNRMCALGGSYGGFMVNYIAGVWNEPWKCLVSHDGNLDEIMAYYDTEELWFPEWEHGGTPWENKAGYAKHNPIDHVAKWRVPMLIIHGAKDYRVVDTQGLSSFTALQRRGVPSKLLYFPDENHWVLKPLNSIQWHEAVFEWMGRWAK
jgi:dipeptidyl aminopeptidase/acylaminoacyl peptidase